MAAEHPSAPGAGPSRKSVLILTGGAAAAAALILVGAVLPAEYDIDPLGFGKLSGLSRLWAPKEIEVAPEAGAQPLARDYATGFRADTVTIRLAPSGDPNRGDELEYKVRMKKDGALVFGWVAEGAPAEEFYYDFHGHTPPLPPRNEMMVSTYKQAVGVSQNGALTAPFDGVHGWYLQNQSLSPVTVRLRVAGYYELIPPGELGNEASILADGQTAP